MSALGDLAPAQRQVMPRQQCPSAGSSGREGRAFTGEEALENSIFKLTGVNIYALMAGPIPPNPAEILSSPAMEQIISQLKKQFDYVILDTPPVSTFDDWDEDLGMVELPREALYDDNDDR